MANSSSNEFQLDHFKEAARQIGTDDGKGRFNAKLSKMVGAVQAGTTVNGQGPERSRILSRIEKKAKRIEGLRGVLAGSHSEALLNSEVQKLADLESQFQNLGDTERDKDCE